MFDRMLVNWRMNSTKKKDGKEKTASSCFLFFSFYFLDLVDLSFVVGDRWTVVVAESDLWECSEWIVLKHRGR